MKKFLLICLSILLAAGCNSDADKISQLEKQNQDLQNQLAKQQSASFELQQKCATQAEKFFQKAYPPSENTPDFRWMTGGPIYTNHYNSKLGKCFFWWRVCIPIP